MSPLGQFIIGFGILMLIGGFAAFAFALFRGNVGLAMGGMLSAILSVIVIAFGLGIYGHSLNLQQCTELGGRYLSGSKCYDIHDNVIPIDRDYIGVH